LPNARAASYFHPVLAGLLALPVAAGTVAAIAVLSVLVGDKGCGVVAVAVGGGSAIATARWDIPYVSPFMHGVLCVAAGLATAELVAIMTLGLRAAAAPRMGRRSFLDDWFGYSEAEPDDGD
jgi:hypothetical protein